MHCIKLLGQRLTARDFDRQVAGFQVPSIADSLEPMVFACDILNGFTVLGTPIRNSRDKSVWERGL